VALYVGSETKVILNSSNFNGKKSKLMIKIDKMILIVFIFQTVLSVVLALLKVLL
jgi:hypothetical protein